MQPWVQGRAGPQLVTLGNAGSQAEVEADDEKAAYAPFSHWLPCYKGIFSPQLTDRLPTTGSESPPDVLYIQPLYPFLGLVLSSPDSILSVSFMAVLGSTFLPHGHGPGKSHTVRPCWLLPLLPAMAQLDLARLDHLDHHLDPAEPGSMDLDDLDFNPLDLDPLDPLGLEYLDPGPPRCHLDLEYLDPLDLLDPLHLDPWTWNT